MAFELFQKLWRSSAIVFLFVMAAPALSEPIGRGVNVTVYSSPT